MEITPFRLRRAAIFTLGAAVLCAIATASGEAKAWWLAVPLAGAVGGFLSWDETPSDSSYDHTWSSSGGSADYSPDSGGDSGGGDGGGGGGDS